MLVLSDIDSAIVIHVEQTIRDEEPSHNRVEGKANKGYSEAEDSNIAEVLEELLPSHVVTRVDDDGWEEKVEEHSL